MQFIHQALTWGFLIAIVPLLIHLINVLRHRRVQWAAMDFLLQSYRRHRKWIWMRQLLLLMSRMAAIAFVVAMLAQWVTRDQWLDFFGGKSTHHYVLLDDSLSMSERSGATSAFDLGRQTLARIVQRAAAAETPQKLTVLRFSRCVSRAANADETLGQIADFNAVDIDTRLDERLEDRRTSLEVSQLAVGPGPALELLKQVISRDNTEERVVHIISDFRDTDWGTPVDLRDSLLDLERTGAEIHMVACAKIAQPNLAIIGIESGEDTRAAGIPLFANVEVKNFGNETARRVQLKARSLFFDPGIVAAGDVDRAAGEVEDLPTVVIDEIKPGQSETRRVAAFFPKAGKHVLDASLIDDAVSGDNRRWMVADVPDGVPVLVIDGTSQQKHGYYLQAVFQPGPRARTGISPELQQPSFLRDIAAKDLRRFSVVYLLDVERLDDQSLEKLEDYVRSGGGLAIFLGDNVSISAYNSSWYKSGAGLLPLPLERMDILPERGDDTTDIVVSDHPVFRVFLGENNPFIRLVTISKYFRTRADWSPPVSSTVSVVAQLRNRQPFAVEQRFGEGRVMLFMTSLAPGSLDENWNNWAQDPSFIVTQLKLQAYLAGNLTSREQRFVGTPIQVNLPSANYRPELRVVVPGEKAGTRVVLERRAEKHGDQLQLTIGGSSDGADTIAHGGTYEIWAEQLANDRFVADRFAVNVDTRESDLRIAEATELLARLAPSRARYYRADEYEWELGDYGGINRSLLLMVLLIALLLFEQWLAYSASYHPKPLTVSAGVR